MVISQKCFIAGSIEEKAKKILPALSGDRKAAGRFYVVTTSDFEEELLYVLSSREITLPFYDKDSMRILALVKTKKEALAFITELIQDICDQGMIGEIKEFIKNY